jgi:hypothetical protein
MNTESYTAWVLGADIVHSSVVSISRVDEDQCKYIRDTLPSDSGMVLEKSERKPVARSTAYRHKNGGRTKEQKWDDQRWLTQNEEKELLASIKTQLQDAGCIHSDEVRTLAVKIKRRHSRDIHVRTVIHQAKAPGKNWPINFLNAHRQELNIRHSPGFGWRVFIADFIAKPTDVEQLCLKCASINLRLEALLPRGSKESRQIHTFQFTVEEMENISCKFCNFVQVCALNWNWPTAAKVSLNIHHVDGVFGPTLGENKILLSISMKDNLSKRIYSGWIVPTLIGTSPCSVGSAWGHLSKTVNFDEITKWLEFCDQHHLADCRMSKMDKIPFFWLIDCATRLIVDAPEEAHYAALSYCWGPPIDFTRENPNELPAVAELVIEDALKVCDALAIPYLWVDRYCNSQSDLSILPTQLQNMGKIYASAYVTIIAACGEDPKFGLPGVSTRNRKPQVFVETHGHHLACVPDIHQEIQTCTWSTRGWTYQESLLSKRRLVFTESQAYFQCWNMHCCESTPLRLEEAHTRSLERFRESIHTLRVFPSKGIGKTSNEIGERIQEYLGRNLSKDSDALSAFLGVFQAFRELDHPVYHHWGLPISKGCSRERTNHSPSGLSEFQELQKSFLSSLAWSMSSCDRTSTHLLTRRVMFPSWTWAAWKCLPNFTPKSITQTLHSPFVSFLMRRGRTVGLEKFQRTLGSSDSTVVFEPCVYLAGWVTNVRFVQDDSDKSIPGFQVEWPVPTRRVAVVIDATAATALRLQVLTEPFQVLLLGSESVSEGDDMTPLGSLKNVHAIILQPGPEGTHKRMGAVTWNRLGKPTFDHGNNVMRVNEVLEARRIDTQCHCGCNPVIPAPFEHYVEDPHHVLEFTKARIRLV